MCTVIMVVVVLAPREVPYSVDRALNLVKLGHTDKVYLHKQFMPETVQ